MRLDSMSQMQSQSCYQVQEELFLKAVHFGSLLEKLFSKEVQNRLALTPQSDLASYVGSLLAPAHETPPVIEMEMQKLVCKIVNNLSDLRQHHAEFLQNPAGHLSKLIAVDIRKDPDVQLSAFSVILKVDAYEYAEVSRVLRFAESGKASLGTNISYTTIPDTLAGKLVLVNYGDGEFVTRRTERELWVTERHEELHSLFSVVSGAALRPWPLLMTQDLELAQYKNDFFTHKVLAEKYSGIIANYARSEIISYFSTSAYDIDAAKMYGSAPDRILNAVSDFLNTNINQPELRRELYQLYEQSFEVSKLEVANYLEAAKRLYTSVDEGTLEHHQIDALLLLTRIDQAGFLSNFYPVPSSLRYSA